MFCLVRRLICAKNQKMPNKTTIINTNKKNRKTRNHPFTTSLDGRSYIFVVVFMI